MRKVLLLLLAVFFISHTWAQRACATMERDQLLRQANPSYAASRSAEDRSAQNYIMSSNAQRAVITIPVVVHVVYSNTAGNISDAQVQSQIDRLNIDFHKLNPDTSIVPAIWRSLVADANIQFCLAQRTPTGTATNGIVRRSTTTTSFSTNDAVKYTAQGGDDAWPAASYLNLWACNLGSSLLGYAQFPGGPAASDGVVILNTAFGTVGTAATGPYNLGRTATHEVGHWLGLYHIWGDDNGACSGTDQVGDTPNQGDANSGCPNWPLTDNCSTTSPGVMFMNYMDYIYDACAVMFTNGQNTRMQSYLATGGSRRSLTTSLGCVPVSGGPVTAFTANKTTICLGQSINFTDQTTGNPTSWSWAFPGAVTATSTTQNPQNIVYNTAGTYNVTLTATNAGGSTPLTKTAYITVLASTPLPLKEGFEATTFPPAGWSISNPDASTTWVRGGAGGFGTSTASAYMNNNNYNTAFEKDYLYTPVYNFSSRINSTSKLKFDYAYARDQSTGNRDTLRIMVSTDCGATWTSIWTKGGQALQTTTTTYNSTFVPTATQWIRDSTISLAPYVGQTSVRFAFININDNGNSLLLDNINIDTVLAAGACTRPVAAFVATPATITQGSTITYTDQSANAPTAWAWTFPGGGTATSTAQVPGAITYNTPGTYTTKLRVTNACGSDSTTVTVTVIATGTASGCDTLSLIDAGDSPGLYGTGTGVWGYISGSNGYGDLAKAGKFTNANGRPINSLTFLFAKGRSAGPTDSLTVNIWDANGPGGVPGTVLGTTKVPMSRIAADIGVAYTQVAFPCPVATNATFYAGFNINYIAGDTIAVANTLFAQAANHPYEAYELNNLGGGQSQWGAMDSDWSFPMSYYIFPIQCSQSAPVAAFTANKTSICAGDSVRFTDNSTNCASGFSWQFNGPANLVSSIKNPTITFTTPGVYTVIHTASNAGGSGSVTQTAYITVRATAIDSTTSTQVSCFGGTDGTATVYARGGTSYTYLWSPGGGITATITGRPAGTYTVTVTSNYTCSATASVVITQPFTALTASASLSSAYCNSSNGSVTVTAAGGNGGYTYIWSPGGATTATVTNLAAGTYNVTVRDSKNCQATATTTVTNQSAPVTISFSNTSATCGASNGSIVASINGSSNGAHYVWSRGDTTGSITNVAAGIYTVTITNALGCSASKSDTLLSSGGPVVTTSTTSVACFGGSTGSATATVSGATGSLSYLWSPGGATTATITGKPAGTYAVTVTDGNSSCSATATATITQPTSAVSATTTFTAVSCFGGATGTATVTASGGTGTKTYLWSTNATTATITNLIAGTYTVTVRDASQCSATASVTITQPTSAVSGSATFTAVSCFGAATGTATVTASGGTGTKTYLWSNNGTTAAITNLIAGTYTVTVRDANQCSATASVSVTQPASTVSVTASATAVSCFGGTNGTATATASGGTGTLTYSWNPGGATTATISNKSPGSYTVTVRDANQCSASAAVSIGQPNSAVAASATATAVTCFGGSNGSAAVTATGGAGAYTYVWNPGGATTAAISNKTQGTYTVTVKDANLCSATATVSITQPASGVSASTTFTPVSCFAGADGSATAAGTGGIGSLAYAWSPGGATTSVISNKAQGTYTVTVRDASQCSATAAVTITQPATAVSATATSTPVICTTAGTATVSATGGNAGGYTYLWSPGRQTTASISNLTAQTYSVTVKDSKQCFAVTTVAVVNQSLNLSVTLAKTDATCSNSNGSVTASTTASGVTYLWSPGGSTATSLSGVPAGTYSVTITNSNGCSASATTNVQNSNGANVTTSSTPVTCFGGADGTATVSATGGSGSYTYLWSGGGATTPGITGQTAGIYTVTISDGTSCSATSSVLIGGPSAALTLTPSSTPQVCAMFGTASVAATGGNTGSYTYLWSFGAQTTANISNLTAQTYSVTVKDSKQCSAVTSVAVLNQSPSLSVTINKTDATCGSNNGTATASTTALGVSYLWSPGGATTSAINGLAPATYTVVITNPNGCSANASVNIATTNGPSVSIASQTNVSCNGGADGAVTLAPAGGGSYTYAWSGGAGSGISATGLQAGSYTVTVTSGGCSATTIVTITEPAILLASVTTSPVICTSMGTATATGAGGTGTGFNYLWSTTATTQTITGLAAAVYTVTVRDGNNCSATAVATITTQNSVFSDSTSSTPAASATTANGTATVYPVGGTASFTYLWDNGQQTQTATQLLPGTYHCTVTDTHGCVTVAQVVVGQGPNAVKDIAAIVHYAISPNPASEKCTVTIEISESLSVDLSIYSLVGQKIWSKDLGRITSAAEIVDIHDLASGVYLVKIKAGGNTYTSRLIRE